MHPTDKVSPRSSGELLVRTNGDQQTERMISGAAPSSNENGVVASKAFREVRRVCLAENNYRGRPPADLARYTI
jgi:hypothetical protein